MLSVLANPSAVMQYVVEPLFGNLLALESKTGRGDLLAQESKTCRKCFLSCGLFGRHDHPHFSLSLHQPLQTGTRVVCVYNVAVIFNSPHSRPACKDNINIVTLPSSATAASVECCGVWWHSVC